MKSTTNYSKASTPSNLPANLDAERFVLGSILFNSKLFEDAFISLKENDFSSDTNRRIFARMTELHNRNEVIDRVTVANELIRRDELSHCGGISYLVSLDEGLPQMPHIRGYIRIVREKASYREIIYAAQEAANKAASEMDSPEAIVESLVKRFTLPHTQSQDGDRPLTPGQEIAALPGGLSGFIGGIPASGRIALPWKHLDETLSGLHPEELIILAGRPSMGKSVVAVQMAFHAAMQEQPSLIFSLEMSKQSLLGRLVASVGLVDYQKFRNNRLEQDGRRRVAEAIDKINLIPLYMLHEEARDVRMIKAKLRWYNENAPEPIKIVIIDHLQLMRASERYTNRHLELSEISHELRNLAIDAKVAVVLVSQLNRECERENRRPQLSDLKETGTLEEDGDVVLLVHRPERYTRQENAVPGHAEFIVAKQRNGPTGMCSMVFRHRFQRFDEPVEEINRRGPE